MSENNENVTGLSNNEMNDISAMLKDIMENERKEMKYAKRQSFFSLIISLASLAVVIVIGVSILPLIPKANTLLTTANDVLVQTSGMIGDAQGAVKNLNEVSESLSKMDIEGMFKGVNELVEDSKSSISDAMVKINQMDIEGLNKAITDLGTVVAPLAKLLGR